MRRRHVRSYKHFKRRGLVSDETSHVVKSGGVIALLEEVVRFNSTKEGSVVANQTEVDKGVTITLPQEGTGNTEMLVAKLQSCTHFLRFSNLRLGQELQPRQTNLVDGNLRLDYVVGVDRSSEFQAIGIMLVLAFEFAEDVFTSIFAGFGFSTVGEGLNRRRVSDKMEKENTAFES